MIWIKPRCARLRRRFRLIEVNGGARACPMMCRMLLSARTGGDVRARDPRLLEGMLANVTLFRGVAPRQIAELAARSRALHVRRSMPVCEKGDGAAGLHALAYGQVKLALRSIEGDERVLRLVVPGECFGLAVTMLGRPLPYDAIALEDALLVVVPPAAVHALADNDPRFMRVLLNTLAERALAMLAEVESGSLHRGVRRLATYLDSLAEGGNGSACCEVQLPTTKTVVAARLGVKKETLSRLLRDLSRQGVIAVEQRAIQILDRTRLVAIAREAA